MRSTSSGFAPQGPSTNGHSNGKIDYRPWASQLPWYSGGDTPFPKRRKRYHTSKAAESGLGDSISSLTLSEPITSHEENHDRHVRVSTCPESLPVHSAATRSRVASNYSSGSQNQTVPSPAPKNWSDLVRQNYPTKPAVPARVITQPPNQSKSSLADVLLDVQKPGYLPYRAPLLRPRGLVNTGNMCFMNAVMIFCPFMYNLLDIIAKNVPHRFASDTPVLDAMIMLQREYKVASDALAESEADAFSDYDDAFTPEFVYRAMHGSKQFRSMQRGHQQDAEEFLGFLLDGLHEEFVSALNARMAVATADGPATNGFDRSKHLGAESSESDQGWMEVGKKQKTAFTRTAQLTESVITSIFGGKLRSAIRASGQKDSIILEPYQPLQLDIQSEDIASIEDALRKLPEPETLGEFRSAKGALSSATKQVHIETLPKVLILHLKRFVYDNVGGTQKLWKVVGYPLTLEIPQSTLSPAARSSYPARYRLRGAVYHHGTSATGGHYTADILRQNNKDWIKIDDTSIRPVAASDVAVDSSPEKRRELELLDRSAYILFYERL